MQPALALLLAHPDRVPVLFQLFKKLQLVKFSGKFVRCRCESDIRQQAAAFH